MERRRTVTETGRSGCFAALSGHAVEQQSATSTLVARIDDQNVKIGQLSENVRLSMPREIGHDHTDVRTFMIRSELAQAEEPVVIVGDSITEAALLPSAVCGHTIVNAGIGGADTATYAAIVDTIVPVKQVALIVIARGTNDSNRAALRHIFARDYTALADRLTPHTRKLAFAGIPRIEMTGQLAIE